CPLPVTLGDGKTSRHSPAPVSVEDDRNAADRLENLHRSLLSLPADSRKEFHWCRERSEARSQHRGKWAPFSPAQTSRISSSFRLRRSSILCVWSSVSF